MSKIELPEIAKFEKNSDHGNAWSDHYGALKVAEEYAGMAPQSLYFHAIWQHGCVEPWLQFSPQMLCFSAPNAEEKVILVGRADEAEFLRKHGISRARAIGLPIVYVREPPKQRKPNTLLIVPTHSLAGNKFPDRRPFVEYVQQIAQYRHHFQEVVACVHPSCRDNGLWVDEFQAAGISVIFGASIDDANALKRMKSVFEQFEYVTTNGWGSHVAYALFFGAKLSIYGKKPDWSRDNLAIDLTWSGRPDLVEKFLSEEVAAAESQFLKTFYLEPNKGVLGKELGSWLVGANNQISCKKMKSILLYQYHLKMTPGERIDAWRKQLSAVPQQFRSWTKGIESRCRRQIVTALRKPYLAFRTRRDVVRNRLRKIRRSIWKYS